MHGLNMFGLFKHKSRLFFCVLCVMCFAPLSSALSATATVSATNCDVTGADSGASTSGCLGATSIGMPAAVMCGATDTVTTCLQSRSGTKYSISHCSCSTSAAGSQTITHNVTGGCGTITITYPACDTGGNPGGDIGGGDYELKECTATLCNLMCLAQDAINSVSNCASVSTASFGGKKVLSCNGCKANFEKLQKNQSVDGCSNSYSYNTCVCANNLACGVPSSVSHGDGYVKTTTPTCNYKKMCETSVSYKCAPGYYGTANCKGTVGLCTGCEKCPDGLPDSAGGNLTEKSSCYAPAGGSYEDDSGFWEYSETCNYRDQQ